MQFWRSTATTILIVATSSIISLDALADIAIVSDGQPRSVIVTPDDPGPSVQDAAEYFQKIVRQMTGAKLPIVAESTYNGAAPPVLVGQSALANERGIAIPQDYEGADHYVIKATDDYIALVGNDDGWLMGSTYAAFDLLQRLGCGWFGPDPVWHVIPRSQTLIIPALDVEERPDYQMRGVWMVGDDLLRRAWRLGGIDVPANHNLERLVPPHELKDAHPEWFGPGQPCLTHPDVQEHVIQVLRKQIDESPRKVVRLSISPNDNEDFCQCDHCRAEGNISARMMKFANIIARDLRETHQGRFKLMFLAYWVTHEPPRPMVHAEPEVIVMMVNEGDHAHPLDALVPPEHAERGRSNRREQLDMAGWQETGALSALYEWWIPGCNNVDWRSVPWYSGETALRNLRYWRERGIQYITYESQYENGNGFPIRWPLYYVAARGMWDSELHADQIMKEACQKLYGPAANDMFHFYRTLELAMLNTKEAGGNWHLPSPETIYSKATEEVATAHLEAAANKDTDPQIVTRIAAEQKMWVEARQVLTRLALPAAVPDDH